MRQRQVACPGDKGSRPLVAEAALATAQMLDALDEVIERFAGLARVDGQGDQAFGHGFRGRELAFPEAALLERGGVGQGRVMSSYFNAPVIPHCVDELVFRPAEPLGVDLDRVKVEDMFAAWPDGRKRYARHVAQPGGKVGGVV